MIYQISPVKTQTQPLTSLNRGLIQARHIQSRLKENRMALLSGASSFTKPTANAFSATEPLWFD